MIIISRLRNYPDRYEDGILCNGCDNKAEYEISGLSLEDKLFICYPHMCILSGEIDEELGQ